MAKCLIGNLVILIPVLTIAETVVAHMKKLIFTIITALGFVTDECLIFEYVCDYPERGPKFYGFPFIQETDTTWVFSMSRRNLSIRIFRKSNILDNNNWGNCFALGQD
ncbi:hypothetical protein N7U66_05350 [Lacinutrix neustonica]|uniref:Uncharacterized protein n=1 Tax=Lacinutrix neustonica TaxID=2980107 RepID=A0A9E8MY54_9FLAO|nr:hypothetical protein [Lacinutrix neustonica]WAC03055.1 hypothetical protein N7U66_05350 [Lacinutrix neustonica]